MKITNVQNLPKAIVAAVTNDPYDSKGSDISATRLLQPPRINVLTKRHWDELEEDTSDRIHSLLGQSVHHVIERAAENTDDLVEMRLFANNEQTNGWVLSGQFDYLSAEGELIDFKTTSAWSAMDALQNGKDEWTAQLNIQDWLVRHNQSDVKHEVKTLHICAILRDWSKLRALQSANYPKQQVVMIPVERWSPEQQDEYISNRIALHQAAQEVEEPPICTPHERWNKPDQYAVMKDGRKSAVRLLDTRDEAIAYCKDNGLVEGKGAKIVLRKGEDTRCAHYCAVRDFCTHWKDTSF